MLALRRWALGQFFHVLTHALDNDATVTSFYEEVLGTALTGHLNVVPFTKLPETILIQLHREPVMIASELVQVGIDTLQERKRPGGMRTAILPEYLDAQIAHVRTCRSCQAYICQKIGMHMKPHQKERSRLRGHV